MEYTQAYFEWQRKIGELGGKVDIFKFTPYIHERDVVLDFGCGGGYFLLNLSCAQKAGIEINDAARLEAERQGITVYRTIDAVPDNFATVVISHHALEHVECPLDVLRSLLPKLRSGGKAVFVVPHQKPNEAYHDHDINQHLYTWNPLTLGNLFKAAGYVGIKADVIRHQWPRYYQQVYKVLGHSAFDLICRINARYHRNFQIRVVAERRIQ